MNRAVGRVRLSIVVPVYFNAENLPRTVPELLKLAGLVPDCDLELIFVDDGSRDESWALLQKFQQAHAGLIRLVKLTRNFGTMSAIQAGFTRATGDCIGIIAADLQDPPELFVDMVANWRRGSDAVFAVRQNREDSFMEKTFSNTFYWLLRRFAVPDYPPGGFDFVLIDRKILTVLTETVEKNTHLMTLIFWMGFPHTIIPYTRRARTAGRSRWTMSKKIKLFIDTFVGFSYTPIRFASILGLVFAGGAFIYAGMIVYHRLFHGVEVQGWAALAVLLAFSSGLQLTMLGIIGEYVWRTLDATQRRPVFVIEKTEG